MLFENLQTGLLSYSILALLLVMSPGTDVALVTGATVRQGIRGGLLTMLGISFGSAVWTLAAASGLVAVLITSPMLFNIVTLAGVLYMFYIGVTEIRSATKVKSANIEIGGKDGNQSKNSFVRGITTNLLNPKVGVFYATFLPQFINSTGGIFYKILLLGSIHIALGVLWLSVYTFGIDYFNKFVSNVTFKRSLLYITGVAIVCFSVAVLYARFG